MTDREKEIKRLQTEEAECERQKRDILRAIVKAKEFALSAGSSFQNAYDAFDKGDGAQAAEHLDDAQWEISRLAGSSIPKAEVFRKLDIANRMLRDLFDLWE